MAITTVEEALAAVRQNGNALEKVPENLRTQEVCLEAVMKDGYALQYVPEKLREEVRRRYESEGIK